MRIDESEVQPGEIVDVTTWNGQRVALVGDGRVDPLVERGVARRPEFISAITAPRVEAFITSEDPAKLGVAWVVSERKVSASGRLRTLVAELPTGEQYLQVDYTRRTIVLRTAYPTSMASDLTHCIEAKFASKSGEIKVSTIREFLEDNGQDRNA